MLGADQKRHVREALHHLSVDCERDLQRHRIGGCRQSKDAGRCRSLPKLSSHDSYDRTFSYSIFPNLLINLLFLYRYYEEYKWS